MNVPNSLHDSCPREPSRLIVQVNARTQLDFKMSIADGDGRLRFYIDGVQQAQTTGAGVRIDQIIEAPETSILMWEFIPGTGKAVIKAN